MAVEPITLRRDALTDQVCDVVRERVIEQVYRPGQRLRIEEIAQSVGVSPTPVREALNRLVAERLVVVEPGRGFAVAPELSKRQYVELNEVSQWLYEKAIEIGLSTITDDELSEMERAAEEIEVACQRLDYDGRRAFLRADETFHTITINISRNSALIDLWRVWSPFTQQARVFYRAFLTGEIIDIRRQATHRPIVEAFKTRDPAISIQALREHGGTTRERWLQFVS